MSLAVTLRRVTGRGVMEGNVAVAVSVGACSVKVKTSGIVAAMMGVSAMTARRAQHGHKNQADATNDEKRKVRIHVARLNALRVTSLVEGDFYSS